MRGALSPMQPTSTVPVQAELMQRTQGTFGQAEELPEFLAELLTGWKWHISLLGEGNKPPDQLELI